MIDFVQGGDLPGDLVHRIYRAVDFGRKLRRDLAQGSADGMKRIDQRFRFVQHRRANRRALRVGGQIGKTVVQIGKLLPDARIAGFVVGILYLAQSIAQGVDSARLRIRRPHALVYELIADAVDARHTDARSQFSRSCGR